MAMLCCCKSPRFSKASKVSRRSSSYHPVLPTPPPPVRLSGSLSLDPQLALSAASMSQSSLQVAEATVLVPTEPVELGLLVVEDSESDGETSADERGASSALQLVRSQLRRHISHTQMSRRKARSLVGSSQEELNRRAELKRLMHKRIQEELRSEESNVESSDVDSTQRVPGSTTELLPGGGPRDNIEFSVAEETQQQLDTQQISSSTTESSTNIDPSRRRNTIANFGHKNGSRLESRRASYPDCHSSSVGKRVALRERNSLPELSPSPDVLPKYHPSSEREASSLSSQQLSLTASQLKGSVFDRNDASRDEGLGQRASSSSPMHKGTTSPFKIIPLHPHSASPRLSRHASGRSGTPDNEADQSAMDQSPLDTWLRSQGLRSRTQSLLGNTTFEPSGDRTGSVQEAEIVTLRKWNLMKDSALPDTDVPRPQIVHLYDMDISRQLATPAVCSRGESPSHSDSGRNDAEGTPMGQHGTADGTTRHADIYLAKLTTVQKVPGGTVTDSSSRYPSTQNILNSSPGTSQSRLSDLVHGRKNSLASRVSIFKCPGNPYDQSSSAINSYLNVGGQDTRANTKTPLFSPISETITSQQTSENVSRGWSSARSTPTITINKAGNDARDTSSSNDDSPKPSLLARLHLTIPRRSRSGGKGKRPAGGSTFSESWARFPSFNRAERNGAAGHVDRVSAKDFGIMAGEQGSIGHSANDKAKRNAQPESGSQTMSSRLGRAVKSTLKKLIPSRTPSLGNTSQSSRTPRRSDNRSNLEYQELELQPTEEGYQDLVALEHEIQHMKGSPCPSPGLDAATEVNKVTFSQRLAALLHSDGASDLNVDLRQPSGSSAPNGHKPTTPAANAMRSRKDSTTTTDRFATPLTSMSMGSNDNASFQSYPLPSRPQSRATPFSEMLTDISSHGQSATPLGKGKMRSATISDIDPDLTSERASSLGKATQFGT
ncbi:hypothetical protein QBC46DRAFT_429516 [Diplogelasinospora grovesii]|uniref:Uncharacterized protein n=1 Tax=Diplogelasinospora grovesii TaxID=303347 RepID=A0AAN6N9J7_9PEZI|nr:hypothetical protein QBC46DRAFT_429516 [Diplogelasinospora grovesii]